ncbi:MAG TPA: hypothetical protein DCY27_04235 [Desulfobacterales bacterium]|jgi:hypothetical protein|nr:hypothetical protein [Desulfobacterales bacterium]
MLKKVYILFVEEAEEYDGCVPCSVIQGVYTTVEIAQEYLARFQGAPLGGHRPDDYWVDEYEVE